MFLVVFLSTMIVSCVAQLPIIGGCPPVKPVGVFDISKVLGTWYEIAKIPNAYEINHKCSTIQLRESANDSFTISLNSIDYLSGAVIDWNGSATPTEESSVTEFRVTTPSLAEPIDSAFIVLDTDYTRYAVTYFCQDIGMEGLQYAWILSRTRILDLESEARAQQALFENFIPPITLIDADQTECPSS